MMGPRIGLALVAGFVILIALLGVNAHLRQERALVEASQIR